MFTPNYVVRGSTPMAGRRECQEFMLDRVNNLNSDRTILATTRNSHLSKYFNQQNSSTPASPKHSGEQYIFASRYDRSSKNVKLSKSANVS